MVKLDIMMFKDSGKYYASSQIEMENDIPIFKDEFKKLIKDNLPAKLGAGFVVVTDREGGEGFHTLLYRLSEILDV